MLTPRERCIRAIDLEEPDRIPLALAIRPEPFEALRKRLCVKNSEEVYQSLGIDGRHTGLGLEGGYTPPSVAKEHQYEGYHWCIGYEGPFEIRRDVWGVETIWAPSHTYTYTFRKFPLQDITLEEYEWPEIDYNSMERVREDRSRFSDYCLYGSVVHVFQRAWHLMGFSELMVGLHRGSRLASRVMEKLNEMRIEQAVLLAEEGVDVISAPDDVGTQRGMMMHPQLWRKHLKPGFAEMIRRVKKKGAWVKYHTDGDIRPIIPDLVEIGLDILDPVQPECMNPVEIKEKFGDRLCLEKTIGTQSTLPFGMPEDVARLVKERIRALGPSGIILGPCNAVLQDVPLENLLTLYETAKKYGKNSSLDPST